MKKCWDEDADRRPTFEELVQSTSTILRDAKQSMKGRNRSSDASSSKGANPYQDNTTEGDENVYVLHYVHLYIINLIFLVNYAEPMSTKHLRYILVGLNRSIK